MLIYLTKSKLFTEDPAIRFIEERKTDKDIWNELWKRYKLLEYTDKDLCEYLEFKTGHKMLEKIMHRWMVRGEIYQRARPFIKQGVETVTTEFFEDYEQELIDELTRNLKYGTSETSRTIV